MRSCLRLLAGRVLAGAYASGSPPTAVSVRSAAERVCTAATASTSGRGFVSGGTASSCLADMMQPFAASSRCRPSDSSATALSADAAAAAGIALPPHLRTLSTSVSPMHAAPPSADSAAAAPAPTSPRQPTRSKTRGPATPQAQPSQPRGAKAKERKVVGAKAAAASVASKPGGQRPLSAEDRAELNVQLEALPVVGGGGGAGKPVVKAVAIYIGHQIEPDDVKHVLHNLTSQPPAEATLYATYKHDNHTVLLLKPSTAPPEPAGPAAEPESAELAESTAASAVATARGDAAAALAADVKRVQPRVSAETAATAGPATPRRGASGAAQQDGCMAVVLLDHGGVAFFNMPEPLQADLMERIVHTVVPAEGRAQQQKEKQGQGGGAKGAVWRHQGAVHQEEQEFVIDASVDTGPRHRRHIRKKEDAFHISEWDSIHMESVARVLSQSAAIRYWNQIFEDMLRSYMVMVPLDKPHVFEDSRWMLRRAFDWRSKLPLKEMRRMVTECTTIHVFLESSLLGISEPPTSTWVSGRHYTVWDAMHEEFELDDRQDKLVGKAALIKHSCLDLIQAHNDTFAKRSEITIILLISAEIVISLWGLHDIMQFDNLARLLSKSS